MDKHWNDSGVVQTSSTSHNVDTMWTANRKVLESLAQRFLSTSLLPLLSSLTPADWVPASAENYRLGHYGWRVVIPVLSRLDKQRQRILLKGSLMMRHWQSPVCLSRASGCSRELELHSIPFTVAACDGEPVNVQPLTGTDAGLLPWRHTTSSVFIHHLLGGWRKQGRIKITIHRNIFHRYLVYMYV